MGKTTWLILLIVMAWGARSFAIETEIPTPAGEEQQARVMLEVEEEISISSQIDGRIQKMDLRDGDHFTRDQTLVTMDCAIQKASKKKAEAELNAATQTLEAQQQLTRLRSGSTMETNLAAANKAKAEADLEIMNVTLEMCVIKAPFRGVVVKRLAHPRQYVSKGQPILELIDDSTLYAYLIVPSIWLLWLQPNTPFAFRLDETGKEYPASVNRIGVRVDPASQTVWLKGTIKGNYAELKVGMGGMARFRTGLRPTHE